jgi:hypothetical protein
VPLTYHHRRPRRHAQVADRVLRRAEDGGAFMHKRHMDPLCMAWEQAVFNDIWPSLLLGTPVSRGIASMWWAARPGGCAGCGVLLCS